VLPLETTPAHLIHMGGMALPKITRLRTERHDAICESLRLWLDLPFGLRQETRDDLADQLGRFSPPEQWGFSMLNPEQQRAVLEAVADGPRPLSTLKVWNAAISHVRYDTGEIMAGRERLARDAKTTPVEVSRAMSRLHEIGALIRIARGRYKVNPHVGWVGSLYKREAAAKDATPLKLVELDGAS
jgi:hypothetical protein